MGTQTGYLNKHYNINQKDEGTKDDRGRDGRTNFILRIKEQESHLILPAHDDDYDDDKSLDTNLLLSSFVNIIGIPKMYVFF